jgi:hypothetical protein
MTQVFAPMQIVARETERVDIGRSATFEAIPGKKPDRFIRSIEPLYPAQFAQLPQFAFDNFGPGLLSFRARQWHRTSCPQATGARIGPSNPGLKGRKRRC